MALALYRTYRPATFAEVVGQEHVTQPLSTALAAGRINHAYLFSGPRGCGKTSSARILARSLNCVQGPTPTPCGVCDSCVALAPDGPGSLDVVEIDAASHGGVDDARDLRERAFYAPVSSRYKIYIIDEAHMVTPQGFNALLKLVEEPPDFLVFVFATTEPDKVLTTIRSRTHHYPFRLLAPSVLRALLERICAAEGVRVEPTVLPLVVRAGGGSARDSLSVLDQLFAGAGEEGVTYARTVGLLGVTDAALLDETVDALGADDGAAVFGAVGRVVEAGHDPRRFAADLLERLRDLIVLDAVPDAIDKGLLEQPADELERMSAQAARLGTATLSRLGDIVHLGLTEMRGTTSPRLLLELICARMLLPAASGDAAAVLQRLERLERRIQIGATAGSEPATSRAAAPTPAPVPAPAPPRAPATRAPATRAPATSAPAPAPTAARPPAGPPTGPTVSPTVNPSVPPAPSRPAPVPAAPAAGELDAAAVRNVWPELLGIVRKRRRATEALLTNATALSVEGKLLTLGIGSAPLMRLLSEPINVENIQLSLKDLLGVDWRVQTVVQTPTLDAPEVDPRDEDPGPEPPDPTTGGGPSGPPPGGRPAAAPVRDAEAEAISLVERQLGARRISGP